jgi:hypothetical protein
MASYPFSQRFFAKLRKIIPPAWGRVADRTSYDADIPQSNPDTTPSNTRFDFSQQPYIKAGMQYRDVSRLFVSAKGLDPDEESGAYFPPQLIYTMPDIGDVEILEALAYQYDEMFDGGFASILKSVEDPCKTYGRAIVEIEWMLKQDEPFQGKIFARFIYSRDPEEYLFDYQGKPGIYRQRSYANVERMDDMRFMSYAYDPLFNNPYGNAINRPLQPWIETWVKVFGYWRHALEKAGLGSWVGHYGPELAGDTIEAKAKRAELLKNIKNIAAGSASTIHQGVQLENHKLQIEANAFLNWHESFKKAVSILYTGSETALAEGQYGSYAKEESTTIREKSNLEQLDAMRVGAFWTYEFNRRFVDLNFAPDRIRLYPTLQLIQPELILPTTPADQEQLAPDGEPSERPEPQAKTEGAKEEELMRAVELQEERRDIPAIPPSYQDFPDPDPEPEIYQTVIDAAREHLASMPVKNYWDVQPNEAPHVFTVKRLRSYDNARSILSALKDAVTLTLSTGTEAQAWEQYITSAKGIFQQAGVELTPAIRDDLMISFRQARQNAFHAGIMLMAESVPEIVALRLQTREDDRVRHVHALWNEVILAKNDPLLQRLSTPMDFGCRCNWLPVRAEELAQYPITPKDQLPDILPGGTYRYYAQPREREPAI